MACPFQLDSGVSFWLKIGAGGIFGVAHKPVCPQVVLMAKCQMVPQESGTWSHVTARTWPLPMHFYPETLRPLWEAPLGLFCGQLWSTMEMADESVTSVSGTGGFCHLTKGVLRYTCAMWRTWRGQERKPPPSSGPPLMRVVPATNIFGKIFQFPGESSRTLTLSPL